MKFPPWFIKSRFLGTIPIPFLFKCPTVRQRIPWPCNLIVYRIHRNNNVKKGVVKIVVLVMIFVCTLTPFIVIRVYKTFVSTVPEVILRISEYFFLLYLSFYPLVYVYMTPKVRKNMLKKFKAWHILTKNFILEYCGIVYIMLNLYLVKKFDRCWRFEDIVEWRVKLAQKLKYFHKENTLKDF